MSLIQKTSQIVATGLLSTSMCGCKDEAGCQ